MGVVTVPTDTMSSTRRFPALLPAAEHPHNHRHHPAHDPAGPGADRRNSSFLPGLLGSPALQRPDSALKLLVLRLHPRERPADPLHVPVRLVKPSSRVVFSSVILVTLPENTTTSKRKSLTVTVMCRKNGGALRIRP